jgi:hypothetical protein
MSVVDVEALGVVDLRDGRDGGVDEDKSGQGQRGWR